jgi:WD40 repeat protein
VERDHGTRRLAVKTRLSAVVGLDFGPAGSTVAASGRSGAGIWDLATGRSQVRLPTRGWAPSIDVSSDGTRVVTAGGGDVRLWDATSGDALGTLLRSEVVFGAARFSPDGRLVATIEGDAGYPSAVRLIDTTTDQIVETLMSSEVTSGRALAFSPDGRFVAGGFGDGTLRLWSTSGQEIFSVPADAGMVTSVAFDASGGRLATGGSDGLVKVWDARTGAHLLTLTGHTGEVSGLSFSPDGTALASSASDRTVRVWAMDVDDLLAIARQSVTRSLTDEECLQYLDAVQCPPS